MNTAGLRIVISRAAQTRDALIAKASKDAPDYPTFIAAASVANHAYSRTVRRAYARLQP